MSRTPLLDPENQKAIAITCLREETKNLNTQTQALNKLNAQTETQLFKTWQNFLQHASMIIEIKKITFSDADSNTLSSILYLAQTAATNFFNRLRDVLKKEWPKKIATVAAGIQKAKKTETMLRGGTVYRMCQDFQTSLEQYQKVEKEFKTVMNSALYSMATLEIPPDTLRDDFLDKAKALRTKEAADAEKTPCCCGLFSQRKKVTSADDDAPLLQSTSKDPFRI